MVKSLNFLKTKNQLRIIWALFILAVFILLLVLFFGRSLATILDNDVEVEPNSELIYYLKVSYDGVDKNGVASSDTIVSSINSGTMFIEDKLPAGLEFVGFVTTDDGTIGAVKRSDKTMCSGKVVDDTNEEVFDNGVWNTNNTEYTYHGLHYHADTRTVTFQVKNLMAGCELTVGIITRTPKIDDPNTTEVEVRRDFYNFATARENNLTTNSNTVHVFMGKENVSLFNVEYEYTGTIPEGAILPLTSSYIPGASVSVAANTVVDGYTFSGWSSNDVTITDGHFSMPNGDVVLRGSFTKINTNKVSYTLTGTTPEGYVLPLEKNHYPNSVVEIDSLKEGDVFNGYRFLGWTSNDVTISNDGDFIMPTNDVILIGQFELITYQVRYEFYNTVLPPNADNYLPDTVSYAPGATVTVSNVKGEPSGYVFLGWYKEAEFEMPAEDVVIYGEWKLQSGTFEPTISKTVVSNKSYYRVGDVVRFKITVTNTASFAITDVMVKENTEYAKFVAGTGYTVLSDHIVNINTIAASSSFDVYAEYPVSVTDKGTIQNEVEIRGALAENNYELFDKEYKATSSFKVQSSIKICKAISGSYNENVFQFHVTGINNYETWVVLSNNQCETLFVDPSTYKIHEVVPQEYRIKSITGSLTSDNTNLVVAEGGEYEITYTNEFIKKGFLHSFGRAVNRIVQGGA